MAVRAFECRAPGADGSVWFVPLTAVENMPPGTQIVRVRVGANWLCARLDRTRVVEVEGMLLRDAVPSSEDDCPECAAARDTPPPAAVLDSGRTEAARQVQAAAIALRGLRFVVVLVRRDLIDNPGEADMVVADLRPQFGGVELVLMGQDDDGTPHFHGHPSLVEVVAELPVDRMPWKTYPIK